MEKKTFEVKVLFNVTTKADVDKIKSAVKRGIYRGLDCSGNNIAAPVDVEIRDVEINLK